MAEVTASVVMPTGAERTWRTVMDWRRQSEWIPFTRVTVTQGSGDAVGDRVVARTAVGPVGFDDPMEIVRWEPSRVCEVRHLGRVVRGTGLFVVEPVTDATARFVWTERLHLPLGVVGRALFAVVSPIVQAALRLTLRRLARHVAEMPPT